MKALLMARLLLPLAAATLIGVACWLLFLSFAYVILWGTVAFVPLFTAACLWWRQRMVRDEATRPFVSSPEPEVSVTRSLERPVVVAGQVLSRSDEPAGRMAKA